MILVIIKILKFILIQYLFFYKYKNNKKVKLLHIAISFSFLWDLIIIIILQYLMMNIFNSFKNYQSNKVKMSFVLR